jgi:FkbM family methyltransferase
LVLDVGANSGQYGRQLRSEIDYSGNITSFEPLSSAFQNLKKSSKGDSKWEIFNFALGDTNEKSMINIAGNSYSSSILNMLPSHEVAAPESKYIAQEEIEVHRLDSIFDETKFKNKSVYLKIDTQGFESKVINGAGKSLSSIGTIQLEMSLTPLYRNEMLFPQMHSLLSGLGYNLLSIEPGFTDSKTGQLLQIDGIYHRL